MTNDGANSLLYDAENHLVSVGAGNANYSYDGNNLRVKKTNGSTTTAYIFSGSKVIAEYDNGAVPSSPTREYLYAGGTLIATYSGGNTYYHHQDHLSVRISTNSSGNIAGQQGHFPFGEIWYETGTASKWKFTTYERDSESGNDYALARYNVNRLARFSSVDPVDGDPSYPQTWNHYAYAGNDPTNMVDPSGMDDIMAIPSWDLIGHWPCTFDAAFGQFACGDMCAKGTQGCSEAGGGGGFSFGIDFGGFAGGCSGESGGLPCGMAVPPVTLPGLLFPSDPRCDFGTCSSSPTTNGFMAGRMTWPSYADYLDWLQNLLRSSGSLLIGQIGHCWGGDAICIPGHDVPIATANIGHDALDDAVNMAMAAPFDAALMEHGSLFGTRYLGNKPLLNSNDWLRVGWSHMRSEGGYAWRATGKLLGGVHLWANPWRWF